MFNRYVHPPKTNMTMENHNFCVGDTLPKTNIAPTNGWLEYYFPIGEAYFQGRTVSFREGTSSFMVVFPLSC